jgi:hypothetical protein
MAFVVPLSLMHIPPPPLNYDVCPMHIDTHEGGAALITLFHGVYSRNYSLAQSVADAASSTCTADVDSINRLCICCMRHQLRMLYA